MSSEEDLKRGFEMTSNPLFLPNVYKYYLISKAMTVVRLSQKGQITIDKSLRDKLGLEAGDRLDVSCKDNALVLKKIGRESIVDEVTGTVDIDPSILERRKKLSRFGDWSEESNS
jgi:AbrB family looped-hinge helix DNA binding protein